MVCLSAMQVKPLMLLKAAFFHENLMDKSWRCPSIAGRICILPGRAEEGE
jgi:hypothetical protein